MRTSIDPYFFTQIGLDSGALTMLGAVVHPLGEPGEYRGTVHTEEGPETEFYISADKGRAIAQATIDLAKLTRPRQPAERRCCDDDESGSYVGRRFVVHPKGYALFHVSGGRGGFWVNLARAEEEHAAPRWTSRELEQGDIFAAVLVRPGKYSLRNELSRASAEITVPYLTAGDTAYRPPEPVQIECGAAIEPRELRIQPFQGFNIHVVDPARVKIELLEPDDGPGRPPGPRRAGWKKPALPSE